MFFTWGCFVSCVFCFPHFIQKVERGNCFFQITCSKLLTDLSRNHYWYPANRSFATRLHHSFSLVSSAVETKVHIWIWSSASLSNSLGGIGWLSCHLFRLIQEPNVAGKRHVWRQNLWAHSSCPSLQCRDLKGQQARAQTWERRTLYFLFASQCPYAVATSARKASCILLNAQLGWQACSLQPVRIAATIMLFHDNVGTLSCTPFIAISWRTNEQHCIWNDAAVETEKAETFQLAALVERLLGNNMFESHFNMI